MITPYGNNSPNVAKVTLFLAEAESEYRFVGVDLVKAPQFLPDFRALNPGKVQVQIRVDDSGPCGMPVTVFESGAGATYPAFRC